MKFGVTVGNTTLYDKNAKKIISTYGGISKVYPSEVDALNFTSELVSPRGKTYHTAIGTKAKNSARSKQQKEKNVKELEKEILKLEKKLKLIWNKMLTKSDKALFYKNILRDSENVLGVENVEARLVEKIVVSEKFKELYWTKNQQNEEEEKQQTYDQRSEYKKRYDDFSREVFKKRDKATELAYGVQSSEGSRQFWDRYYQEYLKRGDEAIDACFGEMHSKVKGLLSPDGEEEPVWLADVAERISLVGAYDDTLNRNSIEKERVEFMNKVLARGDFRIRFEKCKVKRKLNTSVLGMSKKIRDNMKDVKNYKRKMTKLMYLFGKALNKPQGDDLENIKNDYELRTLFESAMKEIDKTGSWYTFVENGKNQKKAEEAFKVLNAEYMEQSKAEAMVEKLASRESLDGASCHHVLYVCYAALIGEKTKEKDIISEFNSVDNLVEVVPPIHPVFDDIHTDVEHLFNVNNGASAVFVNDKGKMFNSTIAQSQVGWTLMIPRLEKRRDNNKFSPVMEKGSLFVTPNGFLLEDPNLSGGNSGNVFMNIFSNEGR